MMDRMDKMEMREAAMLSDEMMSAVSGGAVEAPEETIKKGAIVYFYYYEGVEKKENYARVTSVSDFHGTRKPWYYITADASATIGTPQLPKAIQRAQIISFTNAG